MIDAILHTIGLCPDSFSHISLANLASVPIHEVTGVVDSLKSMLWKKTQKTYIRK